MSLSDEQRAWLEASDVHGPPFADPSRRERLVIFGAVPLAGALSSVARSILWTPYVVDPRARFAQRSTFPIAEDVLVAWPAEACVQLGGLDEHTAVICLTHAPELDDEALVLALRSPAFYVGAMGSRRNQERRRERLAAVGLSEGELAGLSGPAGLDLGGVTASEAALAILAEAVAALHGRAGGRLAASGNQIHVAS